MRLQVSRAQLFDRQSSCFTRLFAFDASGPWNSDVVYLSLCSAVSQPGINVEWVPSHGARSLLTPPCYEFLLCALYCLPSVRTEVL